MPKDEKTFISVSCYGTAWDDKAEECFICDVSQKCRRLTVGNYKSPFRVEEDYSHKSEIEDVKKELKVLIPKYDREIKISNGKKLYKTSDEGLPEFSEMSLQEIEDMARKHGILFTHPDRKILRMRLVVLLKKTFHKKSLVNS